MLLLLLLLLLLLEAGRHRRPSLYASRSYSTYLHTYSEREGHKHITTLRGQQPARSGVKDIYIHTYAHHFPPTNQPAAEDDR